MNSNQFPRSVKEAVNPSLECVKQQAILMLWFKPNIRRSEQRKDIPRITERSEVIREAIAGSSPAALLWRHRITIPFSPDLILEERV